MSLFGETLAGYTAGGVATLEDGTLKVGISLLGKLSQGGGTLRGFLGALEGAASKLGASKLVIEGRLAGKIFLTPKAEQLLARLGYLYEKLADGTIRLTKVLPAT